MGAVAKLMRADVLEPGRLSSMRQKQHAKNLKRLRHQAIRFLNDQPASDEWFIPNRRPFWSEGQAGSKCVVRSIIL